MDSNTYYVAVVRFRDMTLRIRGYSLGQLKDGFWINDEHEYTALNDAKFWLPPSAILFIEKVYSSRRSLREMIDD